MVYTNTNVKGQVKRLCWCPVGKCLRQARKGDNTMHTSGLGRHEIIAYCFGQGYVSKDSKDSKYCTLTTEAWSKKTNKFGALDEDTRMKVRKSGRWIPTITKTKLL
jgi:hypothetical protein